MLKIDVNPKDTMLATVVTVLTDTAVIIGINSSTNNSNVNIFDSEALEINTKS
jgi:hypothetical protein